MRYSDFIEVNESFQTSINLEYDLNKLEKVIRAYTVSRSPEFFVYCEI